MRMVKVTRLPFCRSSSRREKGGSRASSLRLPKDWAEQKHRHPRAVKGHFPHCAEEKMKAQGQECPWEAEGCTLPNRSPRPLEPVWLRSMCGGPWGCKCGPGRGEG